MIHLCVRKRGLDASLICVIVLECNSNRLKTYMSFNVSNPKPMLQAAFKGTYEESFSCQTESVFRRSDLLRLPTLRVLKSPALRTGNVFVDRRFERCA